MYTITQSISSANLYIRSVYRSFQCKDQTEPCSAPIYKSTRSVGLCDLQVRQIYRSIQSKCSSYLYDHLIYMSSQFIDPSGVQYHPICRSTKCSYSAIGGRVCSNKYFYQIFEQYPLLVVTIKEIFYSKLISTPFVHVIKLNFYYTIFCARIAQNARTVEEIK